MAPIRVVIADDSVIVREGLRQVVENQAGFEVVALCSDSDEARAEVDRLRPDVVLTDIKMPPSQRDEGIDLAAQWRTSHPELGVVVLSNYAEERYALRLFDSGTEGRGYLLKEHVANPEQLAAALRSVAEGGSYVDAEIVDRLVSARTAARNDPLARLTPRERDVLAEIAKGRNNSAIAASLVISERAVEKHINSLFSKLSLAQEDGSHKRVMAALTYLASASS